MDWVGDKMNAVVNVVSGALVEIVDDVEDTLDSMMGPMPDYKSSDGHPPVSPSPSARAQETTATPSADPVLHVTEVPCSDDEAERSPDAVATPPTTPAKVDVHSEATPQRAPSPCTPSRSPQDEACIARLHTEWTDLLSKNTDGSCSFPAAIDSAMSEIEMELAVDGDVRAETLSLLGCSAARCMQRCDNPEQAYSYFTEKLSVIDRLAEITVGSPSADAMTECPNVNTIRRQTALLKDAFDAYMRRL